MKKNKMIERAKKARVVKYVTRERKVTRDELGLALAWARGEISLTQVGSIVGSSSASYLFLATTLREYVRSHG